MKVKKLSLLQDNYPSGCIIPLDVKKAFDSEVLKLTKKKYFRDKS